MGRKRTSGLFKKRSIWQIDKQVLGVRIRESTGTDNLVEAEFILAKRIEQTRQSILYGTRLQHTFKEAAKRYLKEYQHKVSIKEDERWVHLLEPFIGHLPLASIHRGTLQAYIDKRKRDGVKNRTINAPLQVVRHILNLAAGEWMDDNGLTWLASAPKIRLLAEDDKRNTYPLNWDEQERIFNLLPDYLQEMALFKVNTGCRDQEVCQLRWEWEIRIPELATSVFLIPKQSTHEGKRRRNVKNGEDRLVVLNNIAYGVIERQRGKGTVYVFPSPTLGDAKPCYSLNNRAWKDARVKAGLPQVRIHDLKHTFGRRLRAAGVSLEDRQDLLGHTSERITTHYSAAEVKNLIAAANKVCEQQHATPTLMLLRAKG